MVGIKGVGGGGDQVGRGDRLGGSGVKGWK